jgi:hypothetical protein
MKAVLLAGRQKTEGFANSERGIILHCVMGSHEKIFSKKETSLGLHVRKLKYREMTK